MPIINTIGNASGRAYGFTRGGSGVILLSATPGPSATISTYSGYIVFKFTSTGTLNVGAGVPGTADVFVLSGGSPGGGGVTDNSGPGGIGGSRNATPGASITANSPIPVVVGGASTASSFGPLSSSPGTSGGINGPGRGPDGNGNPGQPGPTNNYETGSPQSYGGGGGGGGGQRNAPPVLGSSYSGGSGGSSGGGAGGRGYAIQNFFPSVHTPALPGSDGSANTGGGGGGGGADGPTTGGTGGSGVVIVRFPDTQFRTS